MHTTHTTDTLIIGSGFAGMYLAHILLEQQYRNFLIVAPDNITVSDKSYYDFRSRGIKQTSLKASMMAVGKGKNNMQLVNVLVRNIDDELTYLSHMTSMRASYLGAKVANVPKLVQALREESQDNRIYTEVVALHKSRGTSIVDTTDGVIHCKKVVFCSGGNRARFSDTFKDEYVTHDICTIAEKAGCSTEYRDAIMYHPFYSNGTCLPSDSLFGFDIVDQDAVRLPLTHALLEAHNAHHRFDDICKEYAKTKERFAIKGGTRLPLDIEPHYVLGGIKINKHGKTSIKNMYALGECSSGMHGLGRIGGCALSEIIVMARVVAKSLVV